MTSVDRWDERANVILANPPFMTERGGIRPHSRFGVRSKRSEVLFVDYIMQHLTGSGRAGLVVPEGIIFQSQNAHRSLRENLVENYLAAVVSLPAGVFNPYSGVKTSILILDRAVARISDTVGFFRVESDGFDLGAQRRPVDRDDLPEVQSQICEYLDRLRSGRSLDDFEPSLGLVVSKDKIRQDPDFNLSMERYRESGVHASSYPMASLKDLCKLVRGVTYKKDDEAEVGGHQVLRANNIMKDGSMLDLSDIKRVSDKLDFDADKKLMKDDIFICLASGSKDHIGKVAFITDDTDYYFGGFMGAIRVNLDLISPLYLFHQLRYSRFNDFLREQISGANINNLGAKLLYRYEIPLPPLSVQREIVAEISGYQEDIKSHQDEIGELENKITQSINQIWES